MLYPLWRGAVPTRVGEHWPGIMAEPLDIVIVGAGLSGLATAIQCALSGHSVTVLEGARELAEV